MKYIKTFENFNTRFDHYDMNNKILKKGDLVEVKHCVGRYGQTQTVQGELTDINNSGGITLDDGELYIAFPWSHKDGKSIGFDKFEDYEHGHESYVKKINTIDPKYSIPKRRKSIRVHLVDETKEKHSYGSDYPVVFDERGTVKEVDKKFEEFLKQNYPTAKNGNDLSPDVRKKYWESKLPHLYVIDTPSGRPSYIIIYYLS
jgi:hypothetical protein